MHPIFGALFPATELTLVERTLLRQANQRASDRCAVAERDLKAQLADLSSMTRDGTVPVSELPVTLLLNLRVSVEDFTSSARALHPSAEDLLLALKQTVSEAVPHEDAGARDLVQTVVGWAIEAYFAR
jgi:hypothetical protein